MEVEYIVLEYCPNSISPHGQRIAVVYRRVGAHKLQVKTIADWQHDVMSENAIAYVQDVLDDARGTQGSQSVITFAQLSEMSSGIFRTECLGVCYENEIDHLLKYPKQA